VQPSWTEKLRDIQSITDAALSVLDPQSLLEALVERVKEALQADAAAVLLLDPLAGHLVATASSGLAEEVRQGVRVPVGQGFAGQIAVLGHPLVLEDVDRTKVANPILLAKGIRSLMGAPLLADGKVTGVLHVGTLDRRSFTQEDVDLLQLAADRAALAVQALAVPFDRAAAATLQCSLMPSVLPAISGLQMAARYVPGSGNVGGDWYDVFPLPSGEVCAVIGDVAGSGLRAAVIMGRMRSTLRAYAMETTDPAEILDRLDRKMRHFEPDAIATVLCAIFSQPLDQVRICAAGHLPPVVARPGEPARLAELPAGLLIGVPSAPSRQTTTLDVPQGTVLCLYTDGLVERRDRTLDDGLARLRAAVAAQDPETGCAAVMAAMSEADPHSDDVALLILRRDPRVLPGAVSPARNGTATAGPEWDLSWSGKHAIVTMPKEIDSTNSSRLYQALTSAAAHSPDVITADLTGTAFCDSAGVHALALADQRAAEIGAELRLATGHSPVARILRLTGMDQVLPQYHNVEQSLAARRTGLVSRCVDARVDAQDPDEFQEFKHPHDRPVGGDCQT